MYTVEQINQITKGIRRNCETCPFSRMSGQASCVYRNADNDALTPFGTNGLLESKQEKKPIPCLKFYQEYGLHGYIDPVSGQPVIINRHVTQAILSAIDNIDEE